MRSGKGKMSKNAQLQNFKRKGCPSIARLENVGGGLLSTHDASLVATGRTILFPRITNNNAAKHLTHSKGLFDRHEPERRMSGDFLSYRYYGSTIEIGMVFVVYDMRYSGEPQSEH